MPPNRKLFDLAGGIATLSIEDIDVSQPIAKFPTLTSEEAFLLSTPPAKEAQKTPSVEIINEAPHVKDESHPANSYWDWHDESSDTVDQETMIKEIMDHERTRQLLSADRIQKNALAEGKQHNKAVETIRSTASGHDGYWNEAEGEGKYEEEWEGKCEDNVDAIQTTLGPHVGDDSHPAISYWDWTSVSAKEKKNEFIQRLLEEEKIREQMTIEHIQGNLLKSCAGRETSPPVVSVTSNVAVESYWDW